MSVGLCKRSWKWLYHHSLYCIPTTVSSVLNCARIPAAERLEEPLPNWAFSSTVTRKPRSASRTAISALVAPPPIITTCPAEDESAIRRSSFLDSKNRSTNLLDSSFGALAQHLLLAQIPHNLPCGTRTLSGSAFHKA